MKKLKVALVQYDAKMPDKEQNTTTAVKLIREASQNGADLVLFPECFLTSYTAPDICEKLLPVQEIENCPEFIKWCEDALAEEEEYFCKDSKSCGGTKHRRYHNRFLKRKAVSAKYGMDDRQGRKSDFKVFQSSHL